MFRLKQLLAASLLLVATAAWGQEIPVNPALLQAPWTAQWITCPRAPQKEYGVYHFRKIFRLAGKVDKFIVHLTADNRYRFYVNGQPVVSGPARGDLQNWYFETVDIAPYLHPGENILAATVWNLGEHAPVAQISNQTAFVLQGDTPKEHPVNTNTTWKVIRNEAYTPCSVNNGQRVKNYMVVGPGDSLNAKLYPWGWEQKEFDDQKWHSPKIIAHPVPTGYGTDNLWTLVPRNIPLFEETRQRIPAIRRTNLQNSNDGFLKGGEPLRIAAHQKVSILLDQTYNTVVYPELLVSKGKDAVIKLTYAEALFDKGGKKGNRNETEGKVIIGNDDVYVADGGDNRKFRPLWFKAFRYLQLDIETHDEPLLINDLYGMRTGYPFKEEAAFSSNDPSLTDIWNVAWRTQLLCAGETFFDTPYYEQLQYPGDTRLQALITLYMSGDDRLMRKAILDFYQSRTPDGLTQGRYPANRFQVIPTFSLFWVSMVYDYWMHRQDDAFVQQFLPAVRDVLDWHERYIDPETGLLKNVPWWNFIDWVPGLSNSRDRGEENTAIRSLHYSYTLQQAAGVLEYYGKQEEATRYRTLAKTINTGTYKHCYNPGKGLIADAPGQKTYSQHANIMAILSNTVTGEEARTLLMKTLTDTSLLQATFYYRFYLTRAMHKTGEADRYYSQLGPWRKMLSLGLTTFAETPEPTRSDSHAWASTPNYEFLATLCGITPAEPGFKTVSISPALGELENVQGEMPHPLGKISVSFKKNKKSLTGTIILPEGLNGKFVYKGYEKALHAGKQEINVTL